MSSRIILSLPPHCWAHKHVSTFFFNGFWRFQVRPSCLCSKHFMTELSPQPHFYLSAFRKMIQHELERPHCNLGEACKPVDRSRSIAVNPLPHVYLQNFPSLHTAAVGLYEITTPRTTLPQALGELPSCFLFLGN